jgi:uncharacterized protein YcnI
VRHIRTVAAAVVVAAGALPAAASAHVTLQPSTAPADGFTRLDVRVPNERDDAATVKVDVQLPPGFAFVSYEPRPGWKVTVKRAKAEQPIEVEGGFEVDEEVRRITWQGGRIGPGEVVRWIGPEDADEPAPIVTLTGASSGGCHGVPGSDPDTAVSSDDGAAGGASFLRRTR